MLFNNRIIISNSGLLADLSRPLSDLSADAEAFDLAATDYMYLGSDLPFNHRFFRFGDTPNSESAEIENIWIWNGQEWVPAVDVHDGTAVGGTSFAQSGIVQWTTDRNESWACEETTENMTGSGLTSLKIYGMYWVRIKMSAAITSGTELKYVGHCFSNDIDLAMRYPDLMLTATLDAFQTGKTDWNDQHILAAEDIVRYLERHRELWSPNQILNWQRFTQAGVHKCAEIAYSGFSGDDLEVMRARAEKNYRISFNQGAFNVDRNKDGHVQRSERTNMAGLRRG